jgi:hypothetical protein
MSDRDLPLFLTVEEVMALMRWGRTKVYGLTTEWRVTNGKSGLRYASRNPMRIPISAIEELAGGPLDPALVRAAISTPKLTAVREPVIDLTDPKPTDEPEPRPARRSRRHTTDQPALFDLPPAR